MVKRNYRRLLELEKTLMSTLHTFQFQPHPPSEALWQHNNTQSLFTLQ